MFILINIKNSSIVVWYVLFISDLISVLQPYDLVLQTYTLCNKPFLFSCHQVAAASLHPVSSLSCQSVVCGHGMRYRNLSCYVSDGTSDGDGSLVDEELCSSLELAVDGDKQIKLKEACTLPCPGDKSVSFSFLLCMSKLRESHLSKKESRGIKMFLQPGCHNRWQISDTDKVMPSVFTNRRKIKYINKVQQFIESQQIWSRSIF